MCKNASIAYVLAVVSLVGLDLRRIEREGGLQVASTVVSAVVSAVVPTVVAAVVASVVASVVAVLAVVLPTVLSVVVTALLAAAVVLLTAIVILLPTVVASLLATVVSALLAAAVVSSSSSAADRITLIVERLDGSEVGRDAKEAARGTSSQTQDQSVIVGTQGTGRDAPVERVGDRAVSDIQGSDGCFGF